MIHREIHAMFTNWIRLLGEAYPAITQKKSRPDKGAAYPCFLKAQWNCMAPAHVLSAGHLSPP